MSNSEDQRAPSFSLIAPFYDELMKDVPYALWARHVLFLAHHFDVDPGRVLDLACGTGTVSLLLARRGLSVVGVDGSEAMLDVARRKAVETRATLPFSRADMRDFEVEGTFDLAICLYDSLNNILEPEGVRDCFTCVRRHLAPGGLFIFDVNTEYAFRAQLFTQSSLHSQAPVQYRWQSRYDYARRLCTVEMDFWVLEGERRRHYSELHLQRPYSRGELEQILVEAGLTPLAAFDGLSLRPPQRQTDRMYVVARAEEEAARAEVEGRSAEYHQSSRSEVS